MTTYTPDHRTIASCACVHRRLSEALLMLEQARGLAVDAFNMLEAPVDESCTALEKLGRAGQLRRAAEAELTAALAAIEHPPPHADVPLRTPAERGTVGTTTAAA